MITFEKNERVDSVKTVVPGKTVRVGDFSVKVEKLLGKGKGGYSWLAVCNGHEYVLKQIHHEPCSYYVFGDKLQSELNDYERLSALGIRMPRMLAVDKDNELILKEYIAGNTVMDMVMSGILPTSCMEQVRQMCSVLYKAGLNIDWFPTNFIFRNSLLYYVDYECNPYSEEWNFENWGVKYWSRTPELEKWVKENR